MYGHSGRLGMKIVCTILQDFMIRRISLFRGGGIPVRFIFVYLFSVFRRGSDNSLHANPYSVTALDTVLDYQGIIPRLTVGDVMDMKGDVVCSVYE